MGYLDEKGVEIIPAKFDGVKFFSVGANGYAEVKSGAKMGLFTTTGKQLVPAEYESVKLSANDRIEVKNAGKIGYYDMQSNLLVPCKYDAILFALDGRAQVKSGGKFGAIAPVVVLIESPEGVKV
jgi:hypothetical protein